MYFENLNQLEDSAAFEEENIDQEYMILVGQESKDEVKNLISYLNQQEIDFFGGVYPKLIAKGDVHFKGLIIKELEPVYSEMILPFLMKEVPDLDSNKDYTGIIVGDGFSNKNNDLVNTVEQKLDANINLIGGGSAYYENNLGIHNLKQDSVVFNNNGFFEDAFHLCIIEENSQTDVKFGWQIVDGPFEVTKTKENVVCEIDYENPFDLYQYGLEDLANIHITEDDFLVYASIYSLGIVENGEVIDVRVPLETTPEGYLKFVNSITEGDQFYLVKADKSAFIDELNDLNPALKNKDQETLVFSCLSRDLFWEDDFKEEIKTIDSKALYRAEGAVTVGEFSTNNFNDELRIHEGASVITRLTT